MGCNASRHGAEDALIQNKLRPRFHLRLEEIRRKKRSRGLKETTPSKQELLEKHSCEEYDNIASHNEPLFHDARKSMSSIERFPCRLSYEGSNANQFANRLSYEGPKADHLASRLSYEGPAATQATRITTKDATDVIGSWTERVKNEAQKEALCDVGSITPGAKYETNREDSCNVAHSLDKFMDEIKRENLCGNETISNGSFKMNSNERNQKLMNAVAAANQEVKTVEFTGLGHVEDEDEDDDDGRRLSYAGSDFPGSPSFRIYFADNDNQNDEGKNDGFIYSFERGTSVADNFERPTSARLKDSSFKPISSFNNSTQRGPAALDISKDSVNKKATRRKRRGLKKVIPKGGNSAVKNLFNVRSCTRKSSVQDHTRLPTERP